MWDWLKFGITLFGFYAFYRAGRADGQQACQRELQSLLEVQADTIRKLCARLEGQLALAERVTQRVTPPS